MSLVNKLLKNSKLDHTAILSKSKVFGKKESLITSIPALNIALAGSVSDGLKPGLFTIAAKSRHFKTNFALVMASTFQKKYPDGVVLFYDSEFGSPEDYFTAAGIDFERVVHTPITNIEELKFDLMGQLEGLDKGDKVMILIDSIGNLASKKEVEDALKESGAQDMTRAKQLKSLWRMVTPHLNLKDLMCVAINHVYDTQEMYSQEVVSGGTGGILSSDIIWTIGRQQEQDSQKKLRGWNFIINIYKSRHVKEKSKIPVTVLFDGGIYKWSGLWELASEAGFIHAINKQKFQWIDSETGEVWSPEGKRSTLEKSEYFEKLLGDPRFNKFVEDKYKVVHDSLIGDSAEADDDDVIDEGDE